MKSLMYKCQMYLVIFEGTPFAILDKPGCDHFIATSTGGCTTKLLPFKLLYKDIKVEIKAGMQFGTTNYKIKTVGYKIVRNYYITPDQLIFSETIKLN